MASHFQKQCHKSLKVLQMKSRIMSLSPVSTAAACRSVLHNGVCQRGQIAERH